MAEQAEGGWACRRCGSNTAPRIAFAPWPGQLGRTIQEAVCDNCWNEWTAMQTRIINEYRLNVLDPAHKKALAEQMEYFLGLRKPDENA